MNIYIKDKKRRMSKLIPLTELNVDNFVDLLKDSDIIVYENIQGSKIFIQYDGKNFLIRTRDINNEPINKIDLALQKYYMPVWSYLEGLDERIKKLIPKNYTFLCQYFYDEQPSHIKYDVLPKNHLILTSIVKGNKFTFNYNEVVEYANLLNIEYQPVIFKGKLNQKQIELITYFLNTAPSDLDYIFGESNFAYFFYKILNPVINNSLLMGHGKYQENLEKLILRIDNNEEIAFSILNPLYKKQDNEKSEFVDIYTILLVEFLEFLQITNLSKIGLKSTNSDDLYLEMMSMLFNSYCKNRSEKIINFDFSIPPFFQEDKYKINLDLVQNTQTKSWIAKDSKIEYFFKVILSSFRHRKKKVIGVFNETTLRIFNDMVDQIESIIDKKMKVEKEISLSKDQLLNFSDFYQVNYPSDGDGNIYPDLYKDLSQEDGISVKKMVGKKK